MLDSRAPLEGLMGGGGGANAFGGNKMLQFNQTGGMPQALANMSEEELMRFMQAAQKMGSTPIANPAMTGGVGQTQGFSPFSSPNGQYIFTGGLPYQPDFRADRLGNLTTLASRLSRGPLGDLMAEGLGFAREPLREDKRDKVKRVSGGRKGRQISGG